MEKPTAAKLRTFYEQVSLVLQRYKSFRTSDTYSHIFLESMVKSIPNSLDNTIR